VADDFDIECDGDGVLWVVHEDGSETLLTDFIVGLETLPPKVGRPFPGSLNA
jgi:hypothetical protein